MDGLLPSCTGPGCALVLLAAWCLGSVHGQDPPACAWSRDPACSHFEFGGGFFGGKMGDKTCPPGTQVIRDGATCGKASAAAGFSFDNSLAEGTECHFCSGCQPNVFRLSAEHGPMAKWICAKAPDPPAAEPKAPDPPTAEPKAGAPMPSRAAGIAWPDCQEPSTVIRGSAGEALWANLQGYGATIGCFLDDCMSTDKFVAGEIDSCAKVCISLPECQFWVWGIEEGEQKCWFRTGDKGREVGEGWTSGSRACAPPGTEPLALGNTECWAEGFGYAECCDPKYGPNGNAQCWDGVYNYDRCCFPKEEL